MTAADDTNILCLSPDDLVHIDEPDTPASLDQLTRLLPQFVPDRLDDLLAVGLVDHCGHDRDCVQPLTLATHRRRPRRGYTPKAALALLTAVHDAAELVAGAAELLLTSPLAGVTIQQLETLATRRQGLLAHGTGRHAIYTLGQRLDHHAPGRRARSAR